MSGTIHSALLSPISIISQEKVPTDLPTGEAEEDIFSIDVPSS